MAINDENVAKYLILKTYFNVQSLQIHSYMIKKKCYQLWNKIKDEFSLKIDFGL